MFDPDALHHPWFAVEFVLGLVLVAVLAGEWFNRPGSIRSQTTEADSIVTTSASALLVSGSGFPFSETGSASKIDRAIMTSAEWLSFISSGFVS